MLKFPPVGLRHALSLFLFCKLERLMCIKQEKKSKSFDANHFGGLVSVTPMYLQKPGGYGFMLIDDFLMIKTFSRISTETYGTDYSKLRPSKVEITLISRPHPLLSH